MKRPGQIRIERAQPGSAARAAERDACEHPLPRLNRIQAGASARMAEEAKRAGAGSAPAGPTIALRAQGGRVVRREPEGVSAIQAPVPQMNAASSAVTVAEAGGTRPSSPHDVARSSSLQPDPPHSGTGRLKSFLRGLFLPEEPSQP